MTSVLDADARMVEAPRETDAALPSGGRSGLLRLAAAIAVLPALIAVLWLSGIELATPDGTGFAQPMDTAVARWFAAHRVGGFVTGARGAGLATGTVAVLVISVLVGVWIGRTASRRALAPVPTIAVALTVALTKVASEVVARPRPDDGLRALHVAGFAYPSTAAAAAAALVVTSGLLLSRARPRPPGWLLPCLVAGTGIGALSRLVLGASWLTDELVGLAVGAIVATCVVTAALPAPRRPKVRRQSRHTVAKRFAWATTAMCLVAVGSSYMQAVRAPGYATLDVRTVDWLKVHGFSSPVDRAEAWWLWKHPPSTTATLRRLPPAPTASASVPSAAAALTGASSVIAAAPTDPQAVPPILQPALAGEGQWFPAATAANGQLEIATTTLRPDPVHPSVTVTLAWMDPATVQFALIAGTRQPSGGAGPSGAQVPQSLQSSVVAAFNSGYKMRDTPGGALEEGHQTRTMLDGLASFVVRTDGTATVGMWGRDVQLGPDVVGVRQNLHLIVDGGQVMPGLRHNEGGLWGGVRSTLPTWRSAVGVDANGKLLYASGNQLTLDVLAEALRSAGAVRAMELDIHKKMVEFNVFTHDPGQLHPTGHKLSPDMTASADRYLSPDQRDFIAVLAR